MYRRVRDTKSQLEAIFTIDDNVQLIQIELILRSMLGNNRYRHTERSNYLIVKFNGNLSCWVTSFNTEV